MNAHPYGWWSLLPSLVAIALAIATRRVVLSMLFGLFAGAMITCHGHPARAVADTLELHLWSSLVEESRLRVFGFTLLMGAMVGVVERSGGMAGLVRIVSRWACNRRRGQVATWMLGMLIFFDDYANTLLLGNTLQPLCERLKISKEKLAYLVDSTAAPVAGLAVISTWVAGEIEFVRAGLDGLGLEDNSVSAFRLFIQSIPYRFYVLWSLAFVLLVGLMQRDFGPMLQAERRCLRSSPPADRDARPQDVVQASGWWNAILPVLATLVAVLWFLRLTGRAALADQAKSASQWQIFGAADSYFALLWGALVGLVVAVVLALAQRLLTWRETESAIARGAQTMLPALAVLWLASALSSMTGHDPVPKRPPADPAAEYAVQDYRLYTGEYLAGLISGPDGAGPAGQYLAHGMPTLIFLLAAIISFATGTSWGTMAIVMPVAIPLAYGVIAAQPDGAWQSHPVMAATVGSVLAGSIFGDHCSPISDTTVLSSQACGCEHTAHVWTQLPYALVVAAMSVLFGTLPVGLGVSVWLLLPLGTLALVFVLWLFGTRPESHDSA